MWSAIRTRTSPPAGHVSCANARCTSSAAATASDAREKAADHAVALTLLDRPDAAVERDGRVEELVVTGDRGRRLVGARLPELRRALDVGEEERHRAGRELGFDRFGTRPSLPGSFVIGPWPHRGGTGRVEHPPDGISESRDR